MSSTKQIKSDPKQTILVITVGMIVVHLITKHMWALQAAVVIGLAGLFSDYLAAKIDWLWMKLTWVLSKIVPNILLSLVFFVFLTPIAFFSRIFGEKNPLSIKNTSSSLFKNYENKTDKASFEKPW